MRRRQFALTEALKDLSGGSAIATLDANAKILATQLPPLPADSIHPRFAVSDNSAGTALLVEQLGSGPILGLRNANASVVTVSSHGNMGLGTANPTSRVHVVGDTRLDGNLVLQGTINGKNVADLGGITTGSVQPRFRVNDTSTSTALRVQQSGTGNVLELATASTVAVTLNSQGNIGVGTTVPAQKLHVVGPTLINGDVQLSGTISALPPVEKIYPPKPLTMNQVAILDSTYGNGTYTAAASSGGAAYSAFDQNSTTFWRSDNLYSTATGIVVVELANSTGSYKGEWVQIQLPIAIKIDRFLLRVSDSGKPRNFRLFGSSDGSNWILLAERVNISHATGVNYIYDVDTITTAYFYYRFAASHVDIGSNHLAVAELRLMVNPEEVARLQMTGLVDMSGEVQVKNNLTSQAMTVRGSANAAALTVQQLGTGSIADLRTPANASALFVSNASNVGIGTVAPTARLHVAGGAVIEGNLSVRGAMIATRTVFPAVSNVTYTANTATTFQMSQTATPMSQLTFDPTTHRFTVVTSGLFTFTVDYWRYTEIATADVVWTIAIYTSDGPVSGKLSKMVNQNGTTSVWGYAGDQFEVKVTWTADATMTSGTNMIVQYS